MKYIKNFSSQGEYDMYRAVLPFPTLCGVPNGASVGAEFAQLAPIPNDEIWYTSADGSVVSPGTASFGTGITVVSNTYADGKGVIKLSGNATAIETNAFKNCSGLTSIVIPDSVTSIGNSVFLDCVSLISVTCQATTPPTLGSTVFQNTNDCPIYVPSASADTYKATSGWSSYASRIQAIQS